MESQTNASGNYSGRGGAVVNVTAAVDRRWMDLPTASDYCCLPVKALRRAIILGLLPRCKPGKRIIVDRADIDRWLTAEKRRVPQ